MARKIMDKALAITSKGIEEICAREVEEIIGTDSEIKEGCVVFDLKNIIDLCKFCYKTQSADCVLYLLDKFDFSNFDDLIDKIKKSVQKIDFDFWLDENSSFRVSSINPDNELISEELNGKVGEIILDNIKQKNKINAKVNLNNPDIIFFVCTIKNNLYLGIDFSGFPLNKRDYKIFNAADSIRPTIAYSLFRAADAKSKDTLLDPYSVSGEIAIEAAFSLVDMSHNFYRKDKFIFRKLKPLREVDFNLFLKKMDDEKKELKLDINAYCPNMLCLNNSKKNAKIAGVNKFINFSKITIEDLDLKLKEKSIDKIAGHLPDISKNSDIKKINEIYKKFFYNADYILKEKGKIVLLTKNKNEIIDAMKEYKFNILDEKIVYSGKQEYLILMIGKE